MTIYEELVQRVSDGETFYINFEKRTLKIGKETIIRNGKYDEDRVLYDNEELNMVQILSYIEGLYNNYKYSLPSERSCNKRKHYFKALPIDELTDTQLMTADRREIAQAALEGFVLCMILTGKFIWTEDMGSWFWVSKKDSDLVILRSWVENKKIF